MHWTRWFALYGTLAMGAGMAQSPAKPKFEVASIKPCREGDVTPGRRTGGDRLSPASLHISCTTVRTLIQGAFVLFANGHVNPPWGWNVPVEGGPSWIDSELYEIDAKPEGPQSQGTMRGPMLQALLEERFQVKTHLETREIPVYFLTVARGGHKLQPFREGSCTPIDFSLFKQFPPPELAKDVNWCRSPASMKEPMLTVDTHGTTLDEFARIFLRLDRPVADKTGIGGRFDIRLEFVPDDRWERSGDGAGAPLDASLDLAAGPTIFTALSRLGLRLESAKGSGDFLVIDRVERPSGN